MLTVVRKDLPRFLVLLERSELKADLKRLQRQLKTGYNIVSLPDTRSQYRADFMIQQEKMQRRRGSLLGLPVYYQAPESLIQAKLRMIRATRDPERSLKDKNDIRAILANTKVNLGKIRAAATRDKTLELLDNILLEDKRSRLGAKR